MEEAQNQAKAYKQQASPPPPPPGEEEQEQEEEQQEEEGEAQEEGGWRERRIHRTMLEALIHSPSLLEALKTAHT